MKTVICEGITIEKDFKSKVISVFKNNKFVGAIENTTASCDIIRVFQLKLEELQEKAWKYDELCK